MSRLRPLIALISALFLSLSALPPSGAAAGDAGLFGSGSPTYDGVFRQSLSILALKAAGEPVPKSAVAWLASQQCSGGGFEAYRADTTKPCKALSQETFTGKDSNSTALAAAALAAVGQGARARLALDYLSRQQLRDGGVPFGYGGKSDAVSTALTSMAVRALGGKPEAFKSEGKSLLDYLRGNLLDCAAPAAQRGALVFQRADNAMPDDMSTAQTLAALSLWPVRPAKGTAAARLSCPAAVGATTADLSSALSGFTAMRLVTNGNAFPSPGAWSPGSDWSTTAWAVIGLVGAGKAPKAVAAAVAKLRANADAVVAADAGRVNPGRTALAILAARAGGVDFTRFGGRNLVRDLLGELTR
jgi:hypothetical protein